jgi:branched-chain amino acid transport system ATP-binding protein
MSEPVLALSGVSAGYGPINVLKNVSLHVDLGEIVAIIGANGAGKTTTLMGISAIHPVSSGSIHFAGDEIAQRPPHDIVRRGLVQIPEGRKIFPRMTVLENLRLGAFSRPDGSTLRQDLDRVYALFPILRDRQRQSGGTLSGGEQQMLAIGRALMSRPRMILMDEPSMGVAPLLVRKIFETIVELNRQGMTILLVEQNARMALKIAHRGYVIETGRILFENTGSALLDDERVKKAYLGD